jgi:hypothetical protein
LERVACVKEIWGFQYDPGKKSPYCAMENSRVSEADKVSLPKLKIKAMFVGFWRYKF